MSPSRNLILKFHEWPACAGAEAGASGPPEGEPTRDAAPTRVAMGRGKGGGRPAQIEPMCSRHRTLAIAAEGPTGAAGCRVVRVRGTEQSWDRLPQRGDTLIARGEAAYCMWLKLAVVGTSWWDYGRTLEIVVRVVEREPVGATQRAASPRSPLARSGRPGARAIAAVAVAVAALGGSAMADAPRGGTYAHLPLAEMNQWLTQQVGQFPEQARPAVLREVAEAVLSEAQTQAPVLTGFLQNSHTVLEEDAQGITIGVNTTYALAVHETHPTRKRWFLRAIVQHLPRVMEAALKRLVRQRGAR